MLKQKSLIIPGYRLHKPSGLGVVRLNGQDLYLGRYGTPESRGNYERVIAEWLANGHRLPTLNPETRLPSDVTADELIITYWTKPLRGR